MGEVKHPHEVGQSAHVIVVNDDPTQLSILSNLLRKEGCDVRSFTGAEEALAAMKGDISPDLVVTDLHMPGIDGWRFCRLLRSPEYAAFNSTPILVVSATFSGDDPEQITSDLGANAFLPAPVDGGRYLDYVKKLLTGETPRKVNHVLIVEDSKGIADLLAEAFTSHGYHVDTAPTGQEALCLLPETQPDIVILDYHLPDTDGDLLIEKFLKCNPRCTAAVITADPNPDLAVQVMKLGARAYVRKPFDPEYLITLCENARREASLLQVETLLEDRTRELRGNEAKYRFLAEKMNDVIWTTDLELKIVYISPSIEKILGYTPEECMGQSAGKIMTPGSLSTVIELLDSEFQREGKDGVVPERTATFETEYHHKNGTIVWIESVASAVRDETGKMIGIHGVSRDITERKQSDEALKRSEERYRGILEDMEEAYYEVDLKGRFTFFSPSAVKNSGYTREELMGMSYKEYMTAESMGKMFEAYRHVYTTGETIKGVDLNLRNKKGDEVAVEASISLRRDFQGNPIGYKGVTRDISQRKQAAEERLRREKFQGILEVAGTICHEMNQPMQIISGNIDLMIQGLQKNERDYSRLNLMKEQIQRVKAISNRLMLITEDYYKTIDYLGLSTIIDISPIPDESDG